MTYFRRNNARERLILQVAKKLKRTLDNVKFMSIRYVKKMREPYLSLLQAECVVWFNRHVFLFDVLHKCYKMLLKFCVMKYPDILNKNIFDPA